MSRTERAVIVWKPQPRQLAGCPALRRRAADTRCTFARSSPDRYSIRKPAHLSRQGATTTRRSPREWRPPRHPRLRKCWSGALPPLAPPARAAPKQVRTRLPGPNLAQAAPRPCRHAHRPYPPSPRQRFHLTCARWFHRQIYRYRGLSPWRSRHKLAKATTPTAPGRR